MDTPVAERPESAELVFDDRTTGAEVDIRHEVARIAVASESIFVEAGVDIAALRLLAQPRERCPPGPFVAAGFRRHVQEYAACRHRDVMRSGRDLNVLERIKVVVVTSRPDGCRVADVDAVEELRILSARCPTGAVGALQTSRCSANIRPAHYEARHFGFEERPYIAAARRRL